MKLSLHGKINKQLFSEKTKNAIKLKKISEIINQLLKTCKTGRLQCFAADAFKTPFSAPENNPSEAFGRSTLDLYVV